MYKIIFLTAFAFIFFSCNDEGRSEFTYEDWDTDQNAIIDNNEFDNVFTNSPYFDTWDQNNNDYISEEEFYEGYITMMDSDQSGDLGPSEWDEAFNAYFGGLDYEKDTAFKDWDVNQDGTLTSEEIMSALEETDYYDKWDHNNNDRIDENEFAESTFTTWDTDGDGYVQAEEYSKWYKKYNRFN